MRKSCQNRVIVACLLVWQFGSFASAAPHAMAASHHNPTPCQGMEMPADAPASHAAVLHDSSLPPCCAKGDCLGDCMHSPAFMIPAVFGIRSVREPSREALLRPSFVQVRVADFFRPPI